MKVALFFGSFNPIHIGHLVLANYIVENSEVDELWFVVSPQNPLKSKKTLLHDHDRYDMVEMAIKNYPKMRVSDVEFSMPRPSYTIDTLIYLREKYPNYQFSLVMGEDNLASLPKWKNYELLLENYSILVYPRISSEEVVIQHSNIKKINAPIIELSATEIRKMIKAKKNVRPMLAPEVFEYIDKMGFYLK
ncbi:MAG: nicotinate (nicotinamide) nucleotide adenylyltransferase [Flavobacteriaceae bacterium]|nr:nicotinate (nicotinamide) nucleotide adenylyltransferase [Flavobacteriaceae bacterium]